jgi:anti-sigma B factor antagonist
MDLGLDVEERDGFAVLSVRGEVDVYTAPRFRERLIDLVTEGKHKIIVDLEGVDFLDSTQSRILKVFEITGLTKVFAIHDSVDAAVGGGSGGDPSA